MDQDSMGNAVAFTYKGVLITYEHGMYSFVMLGDRQAAECLSSAVEYIDRYRQGAIPSA